VKTLAVASSRDANTGGQLTGAVSPENAKSATSCGAVKTNAAEFTSVANLVVGKPSIHTHADTPNVTHKKNTGPFR